MFIPAENESNQEYFNADTRKVPQDCLQHCNALVICLDFFLFLSVVHPLHTLTFLVGVGVEFCLNRQRAVPSVPLQLIITSFL